MVILNRHQVHHRSTEIHQIIQTISAKAVGPFVRNRLADTCRASLRPGEVVAPGEGLERLLARGPSGGGAAPVALPCPRGLSAPGRWPPCRPHSGRRLLPLSHTREARPRSGPAGP